MADPVDAADTTVDNADVAYLFSLTSAGAFRKTNIPPDALGFVSKTAAQTLTNKSLSDSTTYIVDNSDATKKLQFQISGITTGTTRTLTAPDADGTIAMTSGSTFQDSTTSIADNSDTTKKFQFQASGISTATTRTYTAPNKDGTMAMLSDVAMMYLGTATASDTTSIAITSLPSDYDEFVLVFNEIVPDNTDGTGVLIEVSINNGSSYISSTNYSYANIKYGDSVALAGANALGASSWLTGVTSYADANNWAVYRGEIRLFTKPRTYYGNLVRHTAATATWSFYGSNTSEHLIVSGGGDVYQTGAAVDGTRVNAIRISPTTGDDFYAHVHIFGVRNS